MKLHSRIFALLATILLGLGLSSMLFLYQSASQKVEQDASDKLLVAQKTFFDVLDNQHHLLNTSVETVVKDWGLRQSIGQRDYSTLESVLQNHSNRVGADVALFVDNEGVLAVSTIHQEKGLPQQILELVNRSQQITFQTITEINQRHYQLVLTEVKAPIRVGWLGMGFEIDDQMANRYSEISGVNISFVLPHSHSLQFIASSLPEERMKSMPPTPPSLTDKPWVITQGEWEDLALYRPFDEHSQSGLAILFQQSLNEPREKFSQWWLSLLSIFGLISLLALIFGYVFSRGISKPLNQLLHVIDDVSKGDYNTPIRIYRRDEIGRLAKAFSRMQRAVSEREEHITYQASHDSLTGLLNRKGLIACIDHTIKNLDSSQEVAVLANFRLNHFQDIVDALGYSWGDKLIHLVTERLGAKLENHMLAHLNLDEFVLLGKTNDIMGAREINEQIHQALQDPFCVSGIELSLKISVGIVIYPFSALDAEGLLRRAGVALNEACGSQKATVTYDPKHDEYSLRKLTLMAELPKAISENQVCLHYQPKLRHHEGKTQVEGVECLVRWQHPELGFVPPDDFIGLAEKTGYIVELTRWVLARALEQCQRWRNQGYDLAVAVNISALDLAQKNFDKEVAALLREAKLPNRSLIVEVTESAAVENPQSAIAQLSHLKDQDIKLSIDDYGTGYSSLGQLKQLPVHELKIDKSFVQNLAQDEEDRTIVRSTIELAHNIGLSVVAEGVEDEDTLQQLIAWGCNYMQGYFIAKPLDEAAMGKWLQRCAYPVKTLDSYNKEKPASNSTNSVEPLPFRSTAE
ncbi:EAL domain-containing protein [Pseudoteredinibacter isoporae]|uniref:cyclic-guanylate-specific phosphodiesterase n=1 Tax=Pseudoteredinibacter isoporae TaxID=570281 RepID=A0A7X0JYF2_9GAMM|nr:EAL domain-containing protein [Pseudoteredinibacter isoporae]MBB6523736.1 diguanylate cyclase (GGDEF)-like protein [Pseudoteredinibacter isoporae]NHO89238.1 EAL domain-containing protein [Pseudoteredinibacter isoporae]NIB22151.1 EAL domain-containing protein [Pseudoteredinibacter isoporae]